MNKVYLECETLADFIVAHKGLGNHCMVGLYSELVSVTPTVVEHGIVTTSLMVDPTIIILWYFPFQRTNPDEGKQEIMSALRSEADKIKTILDKSDVKWGNGRWLAEPPEALK